MKGLTLALPLALLFWTGIFYALMPDTDDAQYQLALDNFTYLADEADELKLYERIDRPFSGDCEDFAFTLQRQIGGEVWRAVVITPDGFGAHAVLVKNNIVYDNRYNEPLPTENWLGELVRVMHIEDQGENYAARQ